MLELNIQGMTCGHCVRAVTRAVQSLDPAAQVEIDLASGRARIVSTQAAEALAARIRDEGYTVQAPG